MYPYIIKSVSCISRILGWLEYDICWCSAIYVILKWIVHSYLYLVYIDLYMLFIALFFLAGQCEVTYLIVCGEWIL